MKPETNLTRRNVLQCVIASPLVGSLMLPTIATPVIEDKHENHTEFKPEHDYPYFGWNPATQQPE